MCWKNTVDVYNQRTNQNPLLLNQRLTQQAINREGQKFRDSMNEMKVTEVIKGGGERRSKRIDSNYIKLENFRFARRESCPLCCDLNADRAH